VSTAREKVIIAGSGKMARDVGMFFLGRGHDVAWLSRDAARLDSLAAWVRKRIARLAGIVPCWSPGEPGFFVVGDPAIPDADVFIESINEELEEKRALLAALDRVIPPGAMRLTGSSSILPDAIHPACAGLHFFYPVELTGLVEAVFPDDYHGPDRERVIALLRRSELEHIEEAPAAAFSVNRLLLPVQNECFRALAAGVPAPEVDRASVSPVLPLGQLVLMDSIGLDVVYPAVKNFTMRVSPDLALQYAPLVDGLRSCLEMGKRGHKNHDGLMLGAPLPWCGHVACDEETRRNLGEMLQALFVNTCFHAVEHRLLSPRDLELALCSLFGWDRPLEDAWEPLGRARSREVLDDAFARTGLRYFMPTRELRRDCANRADADDIGPVI
jgi:3-hydroxyacyl-CoA dehydrogenase